MLGASISFFASAGLSLAAAVFAVVARRPTRAVAGYGLALAGLILPLLQLEAPTVAAVVLLASVVVVTLLAGLVRMGPSAGGERSQPLPLGFSIPAILGLAGFAWLVLATGSRQYVEVGETLDPQARFGQEQLVLLELAEGWLIPVSLVGLLALCAVIAAVLSLVHTRPSARLGAGQGR